MSVVISIILLAAAETAVIETTVVLPPSTEAVLSGDELATPPQLPNLIPSDLADRIPDAFLSDLNENLFRLLWQQVEGKSFATTVCGRVIVFDSLGRRKIYRPPFNKFVGEVNEPFEVEGEPPYHFAEFCGKKRVFLIGTGDGKLIIEGKSTAQIAGFHGSVIPACFGKGFIASDSLGIYRITKKLGKWRKETVIETHGSFFQVFYNPRTFEAYVLDDKGFVHPIVADRKGKLRVIFDSVIVRLPSGAESPQMLDADGDGIIDIAYLIGGMGYFAKGLKTDGGERFYLPDTSYFVLFPKEFPFAPSIDFLPNGDAVIGLMDGTIIRVSEIGSGKSVIDTIAHVPKPQEEVIGEGNPYPVVRVTNYDKDGVPDLMIGTKWGPIFVLFGPDYANSAEILFKHDFTAPTVLAGRLLVGTSEGVIYDVKTRKPAAEFPKLDSGSVFPYAVDFGHDGTDELLVGTQSGHVWLLRPSKSGWYVDSSVMIDVGEMAIPAAFDFDGDGDLDLFVTNADGAVYYFENQGGKGGPKFLEKWSWHFNDGSYKSFGAYYNRNYLPDKGFEFYVLEDTAALDTYIRLLRDASDELVDEVAFTVAHTPHEVLRAMARLGEADLLVENARDIYKADRELDYAKIIDLPDGRSTILYSNGDTLPPDIYYWYVVHPRILFEIPSRVDVSYWKKRPSGFRPHEGNGPYKPDKEELEWLRHSEDIYRNPLTGQFWRTTFFTDSTYGKTLIDVVKGAKGPLDAIRRVYAFQCWADSGFMRFGYRTQDIQPLVIYYKAYGSCGEQSILFASLARTALIPTYIAIDMGEDHQWDEVYFDGKWHHLDVNMGVDKGIDNPCKSAECMGNKTVTAVVGWRPDDVLFPITVRGYTDTAAVDVLVRDAKGNPVSGGLVIVKSHWNHRNSRAIWAYTGTDGIARLGIGWQPFGYTFEVMTPFGAAGAQNLFVEEGKSYNFEFSVPSHGWKGDKDDTPVIGDAFVFVRNPITSVPYRISSETLRKVGYNGTRIQKIEIGKINLAQIKTSDGMKVLNPDPFAYAKVKLEIPFSDSLEPPMASLWLESPESSIKTGGKIAFGGEVTDNLGVKTVKLEILRGDSVVKTIDLSSKVDYGKGDHLLHKVGELKYELSTGDGGPMLPGTYFAKLIVQDIAGNRGESDPVVFNLLPANSFENQIVWQDNPDDSLPSGSWIMKFEVKEPLRFMVFETSAPDAQGLDLDIFLYRDKNGDGKPQKNEQVASSTSPTNNERIYIDFPQPGTYWFYAQGCTVKNPPQPFNLKMNFEVDENGVARE